MTRCEHDTVGEWRHVALGREHHAAAQVDGAKKWSHEAAHIYIRDKTDENGLKFYSHRSGNTNGILLSDQKI